MSRSQNGSSKKRKQRYPQEIKEETAIRMKVLKPKNSAQQHYLDAISEAKIIICAGPAGTGKTMLAAYKALEALLSNKVAKIVLTRPIVEAGGEKLGFLPGTFEDKVHPYLLPLLDSLETFIGPKKLKELIEDNRIEIAPLAYMRGRTFTDCFCILDEGQNATKEQLTMFLTRIGQGTTMCINGDDSQADINKRAEGSLAWASRKLVGVDSDIIIASFDNKDIVRLPIISKIINSLDSPDVF